MMAEYGTQLQREILLFFGIPEFPSTHQGGLCANLIIIAMTMFMVLSS